MTDEELLEFRRLCSLEAQTMVGEIDRLRAENRKLVALIDRADRLLAHDGHSSLHGLRRELQAVIERNES